MVGFKIPKGEYILSGCPNGGSSSTYEILAVYNGATYRDYGNGVLLKVVDDNPIQYVQVVVRNGYTANNLIFEPMIRYSDSDPTYESYSGQTYDIAFPYEAGTVYGGTLDVTKGELVVDRALLSVEDMVFTRWRNDLPVFKIACSPKSLFAEGNINNKIANCLPTVTNYSLYMGLSYGISEQNGGDIGIAVQDIEQTSDLVSWANSNNLQVCYKLRNPITYTLTPQEITSLLGTNNLWADTGNSNVEYRADTKMYIDRKVAELQALILENEGN
jgi:hypothetical protein